MALVTVESKEAPPDLDAAAKVLGISVEDIDAEFGVILVDPKRGLYSLRVRADRLAKSFGEQQPYRGPFSDPAIGAASTHEEETPKK